MSELNVCSTEYAAQILLDKKYEEKVQGEGFYGRGRIPGTRWVKGSEQLGCLTKTGLVGVIERSGRKLDIIIPGTGWVGAIDWGVSVAEIMIGKKGIGERVIFDQAK